MGLLSCISAGAQNGKSKDWDIPYFPIDSTTGLVTYTDVVKVDGVPADSLYDLALAWMKTFYKSPSEVIKTADRDNGLLDIRHSFYVTRDDKGQTVKAGLINYYLTLQFRDGRWKYTITKVNLEAPAYFGIEKWINDEKYRADKNVPGYLDQIDRFMDDLITKMTAGIQPPPPPKKDDW